MRIVAVVFLIVGIVLLAGGFIAYRHVNGFVQTAAVANGVVTANVRALRIHGDMFYPRIRFRTADGQDISFISNLGTRPPTYNIGDSVTVLYDVSDPHRASVRSLLGIWVLPMILGTLGFVFSSVGGILLAVKIGAARTNARLRQNGLRIQAQLTQVVLNRAVRVNGMHPYRILCQGFDPVTNSNRVFQSANVWVDPAPYVTGRTLDVLIDRDRPRRYLVDTAFLPKAG